MRDPVERKAVLDALKQLVIDHFTLADSFQTYIDAMKDADDEVRKLPSAQPERKTGRWEMKPDPYGFFAEIPVCSECGCTTKMREKTNYCPNCGADMRGEQDGNT